MAGAVVMALTWSVGPGVRAAYSTVADGDQHDPTCRAAFFRRVGVPHPCAITWQVHGARVVQASRALAGREDADGLVSTAADLAVGAFGADCPGVVLAAPDAVAVAHCGWRGQVAGIAPSLVAALQTHSRHPPAMWHALVGPGISGARYEVDAAVLSARAWPATALAPARPGHAHLDLGQVLTADLQALGVGHITPSGVCTATHPDLHSYRQRGRGLVQLLVAWRE